MNLFQRVPTLRWMAPVAVAVLIIGGGATIGGLTATAAGGLPPRTPAELLVDLEQASLVGLSGTVVQTSDLGIPSLPGVGGVGSANLTSLISGTHTLRVWYAGPEQARVALPGTFGESDVIRNGPDLWIWSSRDNTATHRKLGTDQSPSTAEPVPSQLPMTPQDAAAAALDAIGPSTTVTTDSNSVVAGRPAYELVLQPRDTRSLVAQVRVAIDATEHIPLRVQVFAAGQTNPSFEVAFSSVDFARPDAAQFAFNPPPGATVTEQGAELAGTARTAPDPATPAGTAPRVVGSGWTAVVVANGSALGLSAAPAATTGTDTTLPPDHERGSGLIRMLGALPAVSGSWGSGHLLSGKLFSVLITDDGTVVAGAVKPELLYAALPGK